MTDISRSLNPIDSLTVDVLTDDVSDTYVSKTFFAVFEFSNIVRAGAKRFPVRRCYAEISDMDYDRCHSPVTYGIPFCLIPDLRAPFSYAIARVSGSRWARSNALQ